MIGAGSSGLAAAKSLYLAGVPFDCFEKGDSIGGNWMFDNPNGQSACYETLEINTSCARMAFSDFPMSKSYPPYASHSQVHRYFEEYVDHFGFRDKITFNTTVDHVAPDPDGGWLVTTSATGGGEPHTEHYDAVLVANGHHWDPQWPDPVYPGDFAGEQIHAHDYRDASILADKDVVVVGAGNSAMDISVEASYTARSATISIRRGQWVDEETHRRSAAGSDHGARVAAVGGHPHEVAHWRHHLWQPQELRPADAATCAGRVPSGAVPNDP